MLVCSACSESASKRARYNFAEPDPILDADDEAGEQHVRVEHVDVVKPRSHRVRTFGRGQGKPKEEIIELPPWLDAVPPRYVTCKR